MPALAGETSIEAKPAYNLILTKENPATTPWIVTLRSHQRAKYVISGEASETGISLLQRLPWLLQPGVDTIIYDPGLAGTTVVDSLRQLLMEQSPHTVLLVHEQRD